MRIYTRKIKTITAFILVLCLAMPSFFVAASAYTVATHTHVCHDDKHGDDCVGTKECCATCRNFYGIKNHLYLRAADAPTVSAVFALPLAAQSLSFDYISHTSLVCLKIRLNN